MALDTFTPELQRGGLCTDACVVVQVYDERQRGLRPLLAHQHTEPPVVRCADCAREYPRVVRIGELLFDFDRYRLTLRDDAVALTPTEWRVLRQLVLHAGRIVHADELVRAVWGADYLVHPGPGRNGHAYGYRHLARVNIARIRGKIEPRDAGGNLVHTYIHTKPGIGYWFELYGQEVN